MKEHHPTRDILASENNYLDGKCVVLGVTGSIAAYRSIDTARWLIRRGGRVKPVMTTEAARLVSPTLLHWATGEEAKTVFTGETEHIELSRGCDSMLVAPATLSTMAKIAYGVVDNPVALTAVSIAGYGKPLLLVPAMHLNMARTRQYRRVVEELEEAGAIVIPPVESMYAVKYPDPGLVARITAAATSRGLDSRGLRILVTAGPTREWIDRVRFITNPSSGFMGVDAALEAWGRGASVDLVHGPMRVEPPHVARTYRAESTSDMASIVRRLTSETLYDAMIAAAAPSDFRPSQRYLGKYRSGTPLSLHLEPTPKVIESLEKRPRVLVVFAAEVVEDLGELHDLAVEKLERTGADLIVANIVGRSGTGFSSSTDDVVVIESSGKTVYSGTIHKELLSRLILDFIVGELRGGA